MNRFGHFFFRLLQNYVFNRRVVLGSFFLLSACDLFSSKDPLPGTRESYLALSTGDFVIDTKFTPTKVFVPSAKVNVEFPQAFVNFNNKDYAPLQATIHNSPVWSLSIGAGKDDDHRTFGHPVSDGKLIFVSDTRGKISAVRDAGEDGKIVWTFESITDSDLLGCATLAFEKGTLFVATPIGDVIALDAHSGKPKWKTSLGIPIRAMPAARDGRVFVITVDNRTFAFDANTGNTLWTHQGLVEVSSIQEGASPVLVNDLVVSSYSSGEVFVLRIDSDTPLWSETISTALRTDSLASIPHIVGNPIIQDNVLYVSSHGGRTVVFDLSTGLTTWQQDVGTIRSLILLGQNLYILDNSNRVLCFDKRTGKLSWASLLPIAEGGKSEIWTAPLPVNDTLVFGSASGKLIFLSLADGHKVNELDLKDGISAQPIVLNKNMYVLLDSGTLTKL